MVSYKEVRASNALLNDATTPRISVFVGGTSGIGKFTIKALVSAGASVKIYLIGRKTSEADMRTYIKELNAINPQAEIIWVEGEVSLLADTKRLCEYVKSKESRVDLLFLSAGYAPFGGRNETAEGLEITQSLEYYSRMLFIHHLLPLLRQGEASKVISVLGGGLEKAEILLDDMDLKDPKHFNAFRASFQYVTMGTMTMEKFANENPDVTFIHSWPGLVSTGNLRRSTGPNSILSWVFWLVADPILFIFGFSPEECGQRYLFLSSSAAFGSRGVPWTGKPGVNTKGERAAGLFLVNNKCDCTPNANVIPLLREEAQGRIWDHTQEVFGPYL